MSGKIIKRNQNAPAPAAAPRVRPTHAFMKAREVAIKVLGQTIGEGSISLEAAIEQACANDKTAAEKRGWILEMVSGTLRWRGRLDWMIDQLSVKKKPTGWLRRAMLIAGYQIVAPGDRKGSPAQVVDETVTLVHREEGKAPAGFTNAVLRRFVENADILASSEAWIEMKQTAQAAASVPSWFWKKSLADHGEEWSKKFFEKTLERPILWGQLKSGQSINLTESSKQITELESFKDGSLYIQDLSSQLAIKEVDAALRSLDPNKKWKVLDRCAAPGGKSIGLAWRGHDVFAAEFDIKRWPRLRQNIVRTGAPITLVEEQDLDKLSAIDCVWIDAPCSSSGLIRRHPEIRWNHSIEDVQGLVQIQEKLIAEGLARLPIGGVFVYSVCSIFKDEGEAHFASKPGLERVATKFISPVDEQSPDGFWVGVFKKTH